MDHPMGGATCDTAGIIQPAVQMVVAHRDRSNENIGG